MYFITITGVNAYQLGKCYADVSAIESLIGYTILSDMHPRDIGIWFAGRRFNTASTAAAALLSLDKTGSAIELKQPLTYSARQTTKRKYAQFEQLRRKGDIVLSPMLAYEYTVPDKPLPLKPSNTSTQSIQVQGSNVAPNWGCPVLSLPGSSARAMISTSYFYAPGGVSHFQDRINVGLLRNILKDLPIDENLHNAALSELYGGVVDLATETAEFRESVGFIRSSLVDLVKLNRKVKYLGHSYAKDLRKKGTAKLKKDLRSLDKGVRSVASTWMAFRYGATPIVHSVMGAMEYLNNPIPSFISIRKRVDMTHKVISDGITYNVNYSFRVFAKGRVKRDGHNVNLGTNPLVALSEVTPWMFMVNWVLPVGDALGAMGPPNWVASTAVQHSFKINSIEAIGPRGLKMDVPFTGYYAKPSAATAYFPRLTCDMTTKRYLDATAISYLKVISPLVNRNINRL